MDGIAKAKERGIKFGRKLDLTRERVAEIRSLRAALELHQGCILVRDSTLAPN